MKKQNVNSTDSLMLHKKAETKLNTNTIKMVSSKFYIDKLIRELKQHQVELELQNKSLIHAKEKAETAAEKYAELYDFAPMGYFTLSRKGIILELNLYGAQLLKNERSQLRNKCFDNFISNDTKPIFNQFLYKIFNNKTKENCQLILTMHDNSPIYVQLNGIVNVNNKQCLVTLIDITEQKKAEYALSENEIKYRELVENSPDAIAIYVKDKIVFVNNECLRLVGASSSEALIGKPVIQFVHPEYRSFGSKRLQKATNEGVVLSLTEEKFVRLDGSEVDVEVKAMPIILDHQPAVQLIIRDITERKRTEKALKENEIFLKETQIIAQLGTYKLNITDGKWESSEVLNNIFGIDTDFERTIEGWASIIHPDWQNHMENYFLQEVLNNKSNFDFIYKIIRQNDKEERWVHGLGNLKFNKKGQVVKMHGTIHDITERKNAEDALNESNQRYRDLIELAVDGVLLGSDDGYIIDANSCICSMSGKRREEIIGSHINDSIFTSESLKKTPFLFKQNINGDTIINERNIMRPDGTEITIEMRTKKMPNLTYQSILRDITNRKKAEQELIQHTEILEERVTERTLELLKSNEAYQKAEEKFRTVADFAYNWEYWINDEGYFNYISPSCERITGYTAEEFINDTTLLSKIIYKPDLELWKKHNTDEHLQILNETKSELNYRIVTKTGDIRWFDHICRRIYSNGKYLGIRSSNHDITEKIKAENELLRVTVEVEERERNRFSRELHDGLGPLLSTIKLYFQWLAETNDAEKIKMITEKGNNNIESAIQIIRELAFGLSTLFLNKSGYVDAVTNFTQTINDLQKLYINFIYNTNHRFCNVLETTLYRITTELIKNTITYAKADLVEIRFNYIKEKNVIVFTYTDNGIGFNLSTLKKTHRGLGLMNIQQRVKILKGCMNIETSEGKGMKLFIKLPVNEATEKNKREIVNP